MSEREVRQLRLMETRLSEFGRGERPIDRTISDLAGLFWALEESPEEWKREFQDQWGELEIAYAVALDRGEPIPDASDPRLHLAVERMTELVNEGIAALDSN